MEDSADYGSRLRPLVYGLWSGNLDRDNFLEGFEVEIDKGLIQAWKEGMARAGISEEDFTEEDESARTNFILEQFTHTGGFADFVLSQSKANGGKLSGVQFRLSMWINAYNKAVNAAFAAASANPLVRWNRNPLKDSCEDCVYADKRIYRKSVWLKWGWTPGAENLACHGIFCGCGWEEVPKGTRANKGHPRRPHGG